MNDSQKQNKQYFEELVKIRAIESSTIESPIFQIDHTNIIYELLQNADDAKATQVNFELYNDKLIFKHNGKLHFTISNPMTEEDDLKGGKLGSINAITSVTNLSQSKMGIGKIGIGFKTIYQYSITPMIYDLNYRFQINHYTIPSLISKDYVGRNPEETIFVFPFNNPEKSATDCYTDILKKLSILNYPTLFLQTLTQVSYSISDKKSEIKIEKITESSQNLNEIKAELINLSNSNKKQKVWLFSQQINSQFTISVGFFVNENGFLIPTENEVNCFFPINEKSPLKFAINAPFILDSSCQKISKCEPHNKLMMNELANLAARSILLFKVIEKENNIRLIDDNILQIIPVNHFYSYEYMPVEPFESAFQKVFQSEEIIPTKEGYVKKENAYFIYDQNLISLFSHEQFVQLVNNQNAELVFLSITMSKEKSKYFLPFIRNIVQLVVDESTLFNQSSTMTMSYNFINWGLSSVNSYKTSFAGIGSEFIEKQSFEWLHKFYKWISENDDRIKKAKFSPIFINEKGKAVSAFNTNNKSLQLFFPSDQNNETINSKLIENIETLKFAKKIGLTVPNYVNKIKTQIIPKYSNNNDGYIDTFHDFKMIFFFYKYCSYEEEKSFLSEISKIKFILYFTKESSKIDRDEACNLYLPSNYLFEYFSHLPQKKYVAFDLYKESIDEKDEPLLIEFFEKIGVSKNVKIIQFEINSALVTKYNLPHHYYTRYIEYYEFRIEEFDYIWSIIQKDPQKAIVLWNVLLNLVKSCDMKKLCFGVCNYFYYCDHCLTFPSIFRRMLLNEKWLLNYKNEPVAPNEIFLKELPKEFYVDENDVVPICNFLNIKNRNIEIFSQDVTECCDLVQRLINAGMLEKVKKELEEKELEMTKKKE